MPSLNREKPPVGLIQSICYKASLYGFSNYISEIYISEHLLTCSGATFSSDSVVWLAKHVHVRRDLTISRLLTYHELPATRDENLVSSRALVTPAGAAVNYQLPASLEPFVTPSTQSPSGSDSLTSNRKWKEVLTLHSDCGSSSNLSDSMLLFNLVNVDIRLLTVNSKKK